MKGERLKMMGKYWLGKIARFALFILFLTIYDLSSMAYHLPPMSYHLSSAFARQAILAQYNGTVEVQAKGTNLWRKAGAKMVLNQYEKIRTLQNSKATLLFDDGSRTMMSPGTTLMLEQLIAPINLQQSSGKTRNKVNKLGKGFALRTPTAVCSVRGTDFSVGVAENGNTNLDVVDGVVNGQKTATGESRDVLPGQSLSFTADSNPLGAPKPTETPREETSLKQQAKKEVGLDMTREQIQAAAAEEMKLAEYQEGKSIIDVNGVRVRMEEYILRKPKDVAAADRDKAFKFVVLNTRESRFDFFTYKGIFNKTLPDDLSQALRFANGRSFGEEPEFYLTAYEMSQSNLVDAIKDMADGGHLVKVTYDGSSYKLEANSVAGDGKAGGVTDTVLQLGNAGGKRYDPVADAYRENGVSQDGVYDSANGTFRAMKQGDTLWRTQFNRYAHMMGSAGQLSKLGLNDAETAYKAGTLKQPYFQYYSNKDTAGAALTRTGAGNTAAVTNIATLEAYNNAALTADSTFATVKIGGKTLDVIPDQKIGDASYRYLNGRYAFDSTFPSGTDKLNIRLLTYYPKSETEVPFEQYDTYLISDEGKIAPITAFIGKRRGSAEFNEEFIKWNYQQITRSSAFDGIYGNDASGRNIDIVVEPKILLKSGLIK